MRIFISLLFVVIFFSCRRDNSNSNARTTGDYYIKCDANGTAVEHSGDLLQSLTSGVEAHRINYNFGGAVLKELFINGQTGVNNMVQIGIVADSVKTGSTYQLNDIGTNGTFAIIVNGKMYQIYSSATPQYSVIIHIDQHSGGWVSGTFSGNVGFYNAVANTYEKMTITDGSFSTKVVY